MGRVPCTQASGQISADGQFRWDGQEWVPLAAGYREPTSWTRPTNIGSFANPGRSPIPITGLIISELFAVLGLATFVWMLVAGIKFGPWALKKPGRPPSET